MSKVATRKSYYTAHSLIQSGQVREKIYSKLFEKDKLFLKMFLLMGMFFSHCRPNALQPLNTFSIVADSLCRVGNYYLFIKKAGLYPKLNQGLENRSQPWY